MSAFNLWGRERGEERSLPTIIIIILTITIIILIIVCLNLLFFSYHLISHTRQKKEQKTMKIKHLNGLSVLRHTYIARGTFTLHLNWHFLYSIWFVCFLLWRVWKKHEYSIFGYIPTCIQWKKETNSLNFSSQTFKGNLELSICDRCEIWANIPTK